MVLGLYAALCVVWFFFTLVASLYFADANLNECRWFAISALLAPLWPIQLLALLLAIAFGFNPFYTKSNRRR
jgi:hypothetical protein